MKVGKDKHGFTIVELLIVVVVIAILAAITIVAYNGIQAQARESKIQSDISQVHRLIELYHAEHGSYPVTTATTIAGGSTNAETYSDPDCPRGDARSDWVPGVAQVLPTSDKNSGGGVGGRGGCYFYQSDGVSYILSAWNMLKSPQDTTMFRRVGFREITLVQFYYCNQTNIGGNNPTPYSIARDYYKWSYTITNITFCNETPPAGA